jgi:SAM-dependent methyltransferase
MRSIARWILRRLPRPVAARIRGVLRGVPAGPASPVPASATYPSGVRIGRHAPIEQAWPDPPRIANPIDDAVEQPRRIVRTYDVELLEALNAEYALKPIVPMAFEYDCDSVAGRSRERLTGIHDRIGLTGLRVLEVGCGAGFEVWYLARHFGADAWGIDVNPRQGWPDLAGEGVHLIEGDIAGEHGLEPASFDRLLSFSVWEHIARPEAALAEAFRLLKPGGLAWIRANLYRGPLASHLYREIQFPFPHLLFQDDVIADALARAGKAAEGAAWVNKLTWEQYEAAILRAGFRIRALKFDLRPLDEAFFARFEDVLGRYPRADLERDFFNVVLEKPVAPR